jgi:predicted RNA-binding protein with PIN domain
MALARILVDGYSLLHGWPAIAAGKPRHSEAARDQLIAVLIQYHDLTGIPITVFFDGAGPKTGPRQKSKRGAVEVLFSRGGQTADQMIERTTQRLLAFGEVLVVTDDYLERDTVIALGGMAVSCDGFMSEWISRKRELQCALKSYNLREKHKYRRSRNT